MTDRVPAVTELLLPNATNNLGTIVGGVIVSHGDLGAAPVSVLRRHLHRGLPATREVEFHAPLPSSAVEPAR
jgi:hypothetical protein